MSCTSHILIILIIMLIGLGGPRAGGSCKPLSPTRRRSPNARRRSQKASPHRTPGPSMSRRSPSPKADTVRHCTPPPHLCVVAAADVRRSSAAAARCLSSRRSCWSQFPSRRRRPRLPSPNPSPSPSPSPSPPPSRRPRRPQLPADRQRLLPEKRLRRVPPIAKRPGRGGRRRSPADLHRCVTPACGRAGPGGGCQRSSALRPHLKNTKHTLHDVSAPIRAPHSATPTRAVLSVRCAD